MTLCEGNIETLKKEADNNDNRVKKYFTWERISMLHDNYINTLMNNNSVG